MILRSVLRGAQASKVRGAASCERQGLCNVAPGLAVCVFTKMSNQLASQSPKDAGVALW